jgi:hypothetical protein
MASARGVDDAGPSENRVARVRFRRVAVHDRGGDATLRPHARGAGAKRCAGQQGHRMRRQLERAEQPGEPAADDDDVV